MAKNRKHHSRKGPRRGRRVGALGGFDFKTPLQVSAGAVGATYLINGPMKTTSWINMGAIVGGLAVGKFFPKLAGVGAGMTAAGLVSLLQNANVISGIGAPRFSIHGGPPGSMPISAIAGHRRMGTIPAMNPKAAAALSTRRAAAGNNRVIIGTQNRPISSIACDPSLE